MTITLDRESVERISDRAREVKFSRVLVAVIAGVLFGIGWLACKVLSRLWFGLVWGAMAVAEGWCDARAGQRVKRGPA